MWGIAEMFLLVFALAIFIWIIIFVVRLTTSGYPLPYLCYLLIFSGFFLMFLTDSSSDSGSDGLGIFLIWGLLATLFLLGLIFSKLGGGEWEEAIFKALELRDVEIKPAGKVMLWIAAIFGIGLPWSLVLGLLGPY